jgi:hypothetical protein
MERSMSHQFKIGEFSIEVDGSNVIVRDGAGWIVENVDISESGGLFRLPNGDLIDMADLMADGRLAEFQTASGVQGQVPIVPGSGIFTPMTFDSGFFGLQGSGVLQGTDLSYLLAEEDRPRALSSVNQDGGKPTNTNHRVGATGENDDWPGLDVAERPIGSNVDGPSAGGSVPGTNALPAWTDDADADTSIGSVVPPTTGDDSSGNGSENAGGSQGEEASSNAGGNASENAGGSQGEETSSMPVATARRTRGSQVKKRVPRRWQRSENAAAAKVKKRVPCRQRRRAPAATAMARLIPTTVMAMTFPALIQQSATAMALRNLARATAHIPRSSIW